MGDKVIEVEGLEVELALATGPVSVIEDVSFSIERGHVLGVVGESGCGKSMTANAIMGLLPRGIGRIKAGSIRLLGEELVGASERAMRSVRGDKVSMIFQEPMTSLDPVYTIGSQLVEMIRAHRKISKRDARAYAVEMLAKVGIPSPEARMREYPHELSGGMRQRVMIAMALSCEPALLIADEPTTALDVTIQAQILDLIGELQRELDTAVLLVTHDMGVVAQTADDVMVMYAGQAVEMSSAQELFHTPKHPYTRGLIASIPPLDLSVEKLHTIQGNVPALTDMPAGCRFCERCPLAQERCRAQAPPLFDTGAARVRCFMFENAGATPAASGARTASAKVAASGEGEA